LQKYSPLDDIIDSLSEGVIRTGAEGRIVAWNRAAEQLLGYTRDEVLGELLSRVCPPASEEERVFVSDRIGRGERVEELPTRRATKAGQPVEISLTAVAVAEPQGAAGVTYVLRPQAQSLRVFADAVADMLWAADAQGRGTYVSPRFSQFMGQHLDGTQQKAWISLILHPHDCSLMEEAWSDALRTGQRFESEARLRRFDGTYRWFVIRGVPVLGSDSRLLEWIGSCTEIHDLKRSEQALLRSNEELKQFAYAAAHDMQEPLRNVATSIGMLSRQYRDRLDGAASQWMDASIEGAQRLHAMVKDLLTFSTILDYHRHYYATCSLQQAFSKTLKNLSAVKDSQAVVTAGPLPDAGIQEEHAIQVFDILIGNALKYRHPERRAIVQVNASEHESGWQITVSDNGIGFDPAYASLIFRVFKRLHVRADYPGNGIGLAICERIVAHYGGRIWAEASPGQGATFRFTLPGCYS
jgi:PAS domain S-box-containing protein